MGKPEQEIVLMFRKAGKLNDAVGEAARHGEISLLRDMLEEGFDPNSLNYWGSPPLGLAASGGQLEAIRLLLKFGADPNGVDLRKGESALFRCLWALHSKETYTACCVELIRHGANTAVSNKTGMTLEELAKSRGLSLDILRKLATD